MVIKWSYEYSPFTAKDGSEIPAFEIFDHKGDTILSTNENHPMVQQENVARLATLAPELVALAEKVIRCRQNGNLSTVIRELEALLDYPAEAFRDAH